MSNKLRIEQFGDHLLTTNDLDPIYVALHRMGQKGSMDRAQTMRWITAYVCHYHAGVACWMAQHEGDEFWTEMARAAANHDRSPIGGKWERGKERRHFRGADAVKATRLLWDRYGSHPEGFCEHLLGDCSVSEPFAQVDVRVREHFLFGPWISFKCGDLLDRVLGKSVDFSEAEVFMFKDPVEAALMLWRERESLPDSAEPKSSEVKKQIIHAVVEKLRHDFGHWLAPPAHDRQVGLQEIETILCKWKSHMRGHYPLYNDIDDINHGLASWERVSPLAAKFLEAMPKRIK